MNVQAQALHLLAELGGGGGGAAGREADVAEDDGAGEDGVRAFL